RGRGGRAAGAGGSDRRRRNADHLRGCGPGRGRRGARGREQREPRVTVGVTSAPGGEQPLAPRGSTSADLVPPPPDGGGPPGPGGGLGGPEGGLGGPGLGGPEGGSEPGIHGTLAPKEEQEERHSVLVGYGVKPGSTSRRPRKARAASAPA